MAIDIDFSTPKTLEDVEKEEVLGTDKSSWVKTLTTLYEGVRTGRGQYDTFYLVGTFKNASGARTAIKNITDNFADRLPGEGFDLRPVVKPAVDGGKRTSELWAAVAAEDDVEDEDDESDESVAEVVEPADDTAAAEETPKPAKRTRR